MEMVKLMYHGIGKQEQQVQELQQVQEQVKHIIILLIQQQDFQ